MNDSFFSRAPPIEWRQATHFTHSHTHRHVWVQEKKQQKPEWNFKVIKEVGGKQQKQKRNIEKNDRMMKKKYENRTVCSSLCAWVCTWIEQALVEVSLINVVYKQELSRVIQLDTYKPPLRFLVTSITGQINPFVFIRFYPGSKDNCKRNTENKIEPRLCNEWGSPFIVRSTAQNLIFTKVSQLSFLVLVFFFFFPFIFVAVDT